MGEVDISCSPSAKATVRLGSAVTTRSSPHVSIDDATLDTIFCPVDGLSIASTLDDVFCSAPTDGSIVESPTQRRRKELGEVRSPQRRDRQSPLKNDNNRLVSPRTPSRRSSKDDSKHRKAEMKSSPRYSSKDSKPHHTLDDTDEMVKRNSTLRSASKSRIQNLETKAEELRKTTKRRRSVSQRNGVRELQKDILANNSHRTRSSSQKSAIRNLEMRVERSVSSHRRGSSEPRIRALRLQHKDDVVEGEERSSRTRSLERKGDESRSTHRRGDSECGAEKLDKDNRRGSPITSKGSTNIPGRSSSASGLERLTGQTKRALNKRSSSDSRIVQANHDHESSGSEKNVEMKVSPHRNHSILRRESLQSPSGRSRRSPKRTNSNPPTEKTKEKLVKGITDASQRAARSPQRNSLKAKIENGIPRFKAPRSSQRRKSSKLPIKDSHLQIRSDGREKSQRTRGSHRSNSFHSPNEESLKKEIERLCISKDKREESKRRSSKSRIVPPYETAKGDSSKSSKEWNISFLNDRQSKEQGLKVQELGSTTDLIVRSEPSPHTPSSDVNYVGPKTRTANDFQTDKGYLIRPFWRKTNRNTAKKCPTTGRDTNVELFFSPTRQHSPQTCEHEPEDHNQQHVTKSAKKRASCPILYSNTGETVLDAKFSQNDLIRTREHFPTALEAFEAAITPRKEERLALLQTAETNEQHTPTSRRGRIKSLSPTRFFKKASKRFSSAVAQFSERVLPVGTNESSTRQGKYQETSVAQNIVGLVQEEVPRESAVQPERSPWDLASGMQSNARRDYSKEDSITSKEVGKCTSPKQQNHSRTRPRSRSAGRLQSENENARTRTKRTTNGEGQSPH